MGILTARGHREWDAAALSPHSRGLCSEDQPCGLTLRKHIPVGGVGDAAGGNRAKEGIADGDSCWGPPGGLSDPVPFSDLGGWNITRGHEVRERDGSLRPWGAGGHVCLGN